MLIFDLGFMQLRWQRQIYHILWNWPLIAPLYTHCSYLKQSSRGKNGTWCYRAQANEAWPVYSRPMLLQFPWRRDRNYPWSNLPVVVIQIMCLIAPPWLKLWILCTYFGKPCSQHFPRSSRVKDSINPWFHPWPDLLCLYVPAGIQALSVTAHRWTHRGVPWPPEAIDVSSRATPQFPRSQPSQGCCCCVFLIIGCTVLRAPLLSDSFNHKVACSGVARGRGLEAELKERGWSLFCINEPGCATACHLLSC